MEQIPFSIAWKTPLSRGSECDLVWLVQAMLTALSNHFINLSRPAFTGVYDESTEEAVMRIQRACGIPDTGVVDSETFTNLAQMFCTWQ